MLSDYSKTYPIRDLRDDYANDYIVDLISRVMGSQYEYKELLTLRSLAMTGNVSDPVRYRKGFSMLTSRQREWLKTKQQKAAVLKEKALQEQAFKEILNRKKVTPRGKRNSKLRVQS